MSPTASLEVTGTSDSTIVCQNQGQNVAKCINTCVGVNGDDCDGTRCIGLACASIWAEFDSSKKPFDGTYGNITFTCTDETSVDAEFIYEDSGDGFNEPSGNVVRNIHVAQLGVFCSDINKFDFQGNFFQRSPEFDGSFALNAGRASLAERIPKRGSIYASITGDVCKGCTVPFAPLVLEVDEHRLREACIESLNGSIPSLPAPSPQPKDEGTYTARFRAEWVLHYTVGSGVCSLDTWNAVDPTFTIECLNGPIQFIQGLHDTVQCTQQGPGTLICSESSIDNFVNKGANSRFSGIIYVSTSYYYTNVMMHCT